MFGSSIIARLGLDSRDFREGLSAARKELVGLSAGNITQAAGTLISGAAIKSVVEYGARIEHLSESYNVNAESLQRLGNVYEKNGGSLDATAGILKKLTLATDRAKNGNFELQGSFANLGVTVDDLRKLTPEQILLKIGASSMNAADLVAVLGKNALDIRPTLKKLADGTAEFSSAIDSIDIKKLKEADDALKELGQDARVLGAGIAVQIGEGFHVLANDARNQAADIKNIWTAAFNVIATGAQGSFAGTVAANVTLFEAIKQHAKDLIFYRENGPSVLGVGADVNGPGRERAKTKAQRAADQKEQERAQLGLGELAELDPSKDVELRNNIQARYASDQAREVQRLEAEAKRQSQLQDFAGARSTLDRADTLRQSISGLRESEKQFGDFKQAIDSSTMAANIATFTAEAISE